MGKTVSLEDRILAGRPRKPSAGRTPSGEHRAATTHACRTTYVPLNHRRVLCIFPKYAPNFGSFHHAFPLIPKVKGFMPPQGILLIAAYLPEQWEVRFVDENVRDATPRDFEWADVVFTSGMHVQRPFIHDIARRAHQHGKLVALGGPSVSASPEYYDTADLLHIGELGDATDAVIARIDTSVERPGTQEVFTTDDRTPLREFPTPKYDLINLRHYFLGSIQYSSGCPFLCEFCDIPALYGRNPRLKSPEQILRELDAIVDNGALGAVYFVDDNFVADPRATRELLPHLVDWQKQRGYPLRFTCEATLNLAKMPDVLELMREAAFHTVFFGIETPEEDALVHIRKKQNLRQPITEAIETFSSYGIEPVGGIIMGLDTDTPNTGRNIAAFIHETNIPLLTINLLYALPKTALHDRLMAEGRVLSDDACHDRVSNVEFAMPYEDVVRMWFDTITDVYRPEALLERYLHQAEHTFPNRAKIEPKVTAAHIRHGVGIMARILWKVGIRGSWRKAFWQFAKPLIRRGEIEAVINIAIVSHHLITFVEEIKAGRHEACFYADPSKNTTTEHALDDVAVSHAQG